MPKAAPAQAQIRAKPSAKKPAVRKPAARRLNPAEKARIQEIFDRFAAAEAAPRTELNYHDPFTLVVAVALSAQATATTRVKGSW